VLSLEPILVCTSTCDPDRLAAIAKRAADDRVRMLELPLSGTSRQVASGEGVGLVGGSPALADRCASVLDAVCVRRFYLGDLGNASRAKLAVNLILGLNRAAIAEGLVFADSLGLDRESFLAVAKGSAAYSAVMETKGPSMASRKYSNPQSRVDQSLKDFLLILEHAATKNQALPFAQTYATMLKDCVSHGEAEWDNAAIVEAIARQRKNFLPRP
jgi:3-hydroxyisobutyrate dehydrogenase-like beta-hydroxyacid dehydrogenase